MKRKGMKSSAVLLAALLACGLWGCGAAEKVSEGAAATEAVQQAETQQAVSETNTTEETESKETAMKERFQQIELSKPLKAVTDHNPVMTQRFGADPYALVYDGRVYLYMTGDTPSYNADKTAKENTYSNIKTINVISSADLVNWTDHGTVYAAGKDGAATWGGNSWAPAAAYKEIDGKMKFFLYFANSGNGIAVLTADSPAGPFTDPIGGPLISRDTPNCAEVTWLFDPAVLMDDDGRSYIYVGGGIPSPDKASNPGTARVAELGDDMISLKGDPQPIENVPYLFEDSGINKIGDTYFYSYCSNFSMEAGADQKMGFHQGEIIVMRSDNPMGPFELVGHVLDNPQAFFGRGGNNHHCMFEFEGQWYITYHSRILEEAMGLDGGYRSTNVDKLLLTEDGTPTVSRGTKAGVDQVKALDPYETVSAVTLANASGIKTKQYGEAAERSGSGDMILCGIADGAWTAVYGADFGAAQASAIEVSVRGTGEGAIRVSLDSLAGEVVAYVPVEKPGADFTTVTANLAAVPEGTHNLFFTFAGSGYEVESWKFVK